MIVLKVFWWKIRLVCIGWMDGWMDGISVSSPPMATGRRCFELRILRNVLGILSEEERSRRGEGEKNFIWYIQRFY